MHLFLTRKKGRKGEEAGKGGKEGEKQGETTNYYQTLLSDYKNICKKERKRETNISQ